VAGIDFGHSHVAVAVADLSGLILTRRKAPLAPEETSDERLALASKLLDEALSHVTATRADLRRIGLGLPAPLAQGIVQSPGILPSWIGLDVAKAASDAFEVPVDAENDANLAAIAELRSKPDYPGQSLVFLKISSGLGSGIVLEGRLQRGVSGMAGELGHVSVDEAGPFCRCGNRGCLEAYVSVPHILGVLGDTLPGATFTEVIDQARSGNRAAARALEDAGQHLGRTLAMVVNLLDPGSIVIGGDLALAGELVLTPLRASLRRHCLAPVAKETQVVVATLGGDASLIGAVEVALDHLDVFDVLAP
jgi:predicted NBD/HSP70 family sugar kinase